MSACHCLHSPLSPCQALENKIYSVFLSLSVCLTKSYPLYSPGFCLEFTILFSFFVLESFPHTVFWVLSLPGGGN